MAKLELLAKELESLGKDNLKDVIVHVRDDSYNRDRLAKELIAAKCRFFAGKLVSGAYEVETPEPKKSKAEILLEKKEAEKALLKSKKVKKGAIKNDTRKVSKTSKKN